MGLRGPQVLGDLGIAYFAYLYNRHCLEMVSPHTHNVVNDTNVFISLTS